MNLEYPRNGCPDCGGPVTEILLTCDLDEDHERWKCKDCDECDLRDDDLITVSGPPDTLDLAALLQAGKVLPEFVDWVKSKVAS